MRKTLSVTVGCAAIAAAIVLSIAACTVTRKPDGTITVEPSEGGKPVRLPPERVRQITINGTCYYQFQGQNGVWYCFPCSLRGQGYAEPCDSIVNPNFAYSPQDADSFKKFMKELLDQEGTSPISGEILTGFGLNTWSEGEEAPVPMALSVLNTDDNTLQVVIVSPSDWEWPDDGAAVVECLAFPDATGSLPSPLDGTPDALAFCVTGSISDVANSVSAMFKDGFTWETTFGSDTYEVTSQRIDNQTFAVSVFKNGTLIWTN